VEGEVDVDVGSEVEVLGNVVVLVVVGRVVVEVDVDGVEVDVDGVEVDVEVDVDGVEVDVDGLEVEVDAVEVVVVLVAVTSPNSVFAGCVSNQIIFIQRLDKAMMTLFTFELLAGDCGSRKQSCAARQRKTIDSYAFWFLVLFAKNRIALCW
jgi:hypothetical protein